MERFVNFRSVFSVVDGKLSQGFRPTRSGQFTGLLGMILCIVFGIVNIFTLKLIPFCILAFVFAFFIFLLEIPFMIGAFAFTERIKESLRSMSQSWTIGLAYIIMSVVLFLSILVRVSSLIAPAITLAIAGGFYLHRQFRPHN